MPPLLVLINPWIYDFAAYDLWAKPLGLLSIGAHLRQYGFRVRLIDCLDVHCAPTPADVCLTRPKRRLYGTGKFWRCQVPRPEPLKHVARPYSRYGISRRAFVEELKKIRKPAAFLVTSMMTYWYPGVKEAIALIKEIFPSVPVILGGIYARLCHDHAVRNMDADCILTTADPSSLLNTLFEFGVPTPPAGQAPLSYPAFDLQRRIEYICLLTSRGCPYGCQYCASRFLEPHMSRRNPEHVLQEILFWHRYFGVRDFAFYDDALLLGFETHLGVVLERLASLGLNLRFHTPNAVHIREITPDIARLMRRTGFRTIRLGLETADPSLHDQLDRKVTEGEFPRAVGSLVKAGFDRKQIGVYLLMGLPGQSPESVSNTIDHVAGAGGVPYLAEYSPIPHTGLWEKAVRSSTYDLESEPLFHNNTLLPCWDEAWKRQVPLLRQRAMTARH